MLVVAGTLVYAALQNDVLSELIPPMDDLGFTHDNVLAIGVARGDYVIGGKLFDRWITSRTDRRRWDQLDLLATYEQRLWPAGDEPSQWQLTAQARLGPTFGGNFGGQYLQNGWHYISKTGPTVDEGLANDYRGDDTIGVLAGAHLHAERWLRSEPFREGVAPSSPLRAFVYSNVDGQGTFGAGVSSIEGALGAWIGVHRIGAHVEAAVTRYHVADANLALPGGYGVGWQFEWRAGIDVTWSRYRLAYEYRANEGGSGEPIGVVAFSLH
ncbi:MAG TPA: hypothetical protein VMZ53_12785 [Kofleriaceae bacterium]|nr:hypothetical protein [Kofleriaceae bacterium]